MQSIEHASEDYVKIIRFDNLGFHCKPYNSPYFAHVFEFIDYEVKDLFLTNQKLPTTKLIKPKFNDTKWSGCFCFLQEYDESLLAPSGALAMRRGHKINIAYISKEEVIWVRNISHKGEPYIKQFFRTVEHEGKTYWFPEVTTLVSYRWVKMRVDLALERIRLWKMNNKNLPEEITEFYLMEEQIPRLIFPQQIGIGGRLKRLLSRCTFLNLK